MSTLHTVAGKITELTKIASGFITQAAQSLVASTTKRADSLSVDEMSRRLDGVLQTLRGEPAPVNGEPVTVPKNALKVAHEMVSSFKFSRITGVARFTIPAGVTDVDAMKAVNEYFRQRHPEMGRAAICIADLYFYERLEPRDPSHARDITISLAVKGTAGKNRSRQEKVLSQKGLYFSDVRDLALAAALHACAKNTAEDLFTRKQVRGSVPGLATRTCPAQGVTLDPGRDSRGSDDVVAAGSPARR